MHNYKLNNILYIKNSGFTILELVFSLFLSTLIIAISIRIVLLTFSLNEQQQNVSKTMEGGNYSLAVLKSFASKAGFSSENFPTNRHIIEYPSNTHNKLISFIFEAQESTIGNRNCLYDTIDDNTVTYNRFFIRDRDESPFNTYDLMCQSIKNRRDTISDRFKDLEISYIASEGSELKRLSYDDLENQSLPIRAIQVKLYPNETQNHCSTNTNCNIYHGTMPIKHSEYMPSEHQ